MQKSTLCQDRKGQNDYVISVVELCFTRSLWRAQAISEMLGFKYGEAFREEASDVAQCCIWQVKEDLVRCVHFLGFGARALGCRVGRLRYRVVLQNDSIRVSGYSTGTLGYRSRALDDRFTVLRYRVWALVYSIWALVYRFRASGAVQGPLCTGVRSSYICICTWGTPMSYYLYSLTLPAPSSQLQPIRAGI